MRQEIGAKFTILAQERLSASSNLGLPMDDKVLDAEEKVLDEIYARFIERNRVKNIASTKRKKNKPIPVLPLS
jgi:vacuolar-type H+-ATPase subunit E/Vma4